MDVQLEVEIRSFSQNRGLKRVYTYETEKQTPDLNI